VFGFLKTSPFGPAYSNSDRMIFDLVANYYGEPNIPVRVNAEDMLHVKMVGRPGEERPSPPLRTVLAPMSSFGTYLDNEGLRKKITSERVYIVTTPGVGDDGISKARPSTLLM
jgi:capsid protein